MSQERLGEKKSFGSYRWADALPLMNYYSFLLHLPCQSRRCGISSKRLSYSGESVLTEKLIPSRKVRGMVLVSCRLCAIGRALSGECWFNSIAAYSILSALSLTHVLKIGSQMVLSLTYEVRDSTRWFPKGPRLHEDMVPADGESRHLEVRCHVPTVRRGPWIVGQPSSFNRRTWWGGLSHRNHLVGSLVYVSSTSLDYKTVGVEERERRGWIRGRVISFGPRRR